MALTPHRYWKFDQLRNQTSDFNQIAELYIRESVGGANKVPTASSAANSFNGSTGPDKIYDGDNTTAWLQYFGDNDPNCWVAFDYGTNITPRELYMHAQVGGTVNRNVKTTNLYYSDTGLSGPWTLARNGISFSTWTADTQSQTLDLLTPTVEIDATKAAFDIVAFGNPDFASTKAGLLSVINFPTQFIDATKASFGPVVGANPDILATQAGMIAVVRGRTARTAISPWTFFLDGHEYYVLQLQFETLVYDFHAERWYVWGSGDDAIWNIQVGQNWNANLGFIIAGLGGERVSDVVVGDGSTSALYFLDPELSEDYSSLGDAGKAFKRVVTGQLAIRGKKTIKLSGVEVMSSEGDTVNASNMDVTLTISDDQGHSYWSAGSRTVVDGVYSTALDWRSLGGYRAPGRLLRLTDYGALRRIDDWSYPQDESNG